MLGCMASALPDLLHCMYVVETLSYGPKDGELYLSWVKPGETLVEARSDTDVQIDRRT